MERQNVTLSLSKDILQKAKLLAVKQGTSLSGLLTRALEQIVVREERYQSARRRHLATLESGHDLGTQGVVQWRREDLHDR